MKTPREKSRGAPPADEPLRWLGSRLGLDHLRLGYFAIADGDLARLLRLGNLAHEVDVQETVLQRRALHLDVVGKLELALESAPRDALVEHLAGIVLLDLLLALNSQRVFLGLDQQLALAEACDGYGDAIVVLAGALDVVGRVARSGLKAVQHREQPVKADGRTIEGSKIESSHSISSYERHAVVRHLGRTPV